MVEALSTMTNSTATGSLRMAWRQRGRSWVWSSQTGMTIVTFAVIVVRTTRAAGDEACQGRS
jgi:hypothetical protein